ncbi:hypothetical protein ABGB16_06320 [Micromonospora sp. B11E3]|uniref:hypothetical protein n=1 Tax=Micromonospora sp. B11E3 TaxID=3153562 RepID=UPI00325EC823
MEFADAPMSLALYMGAQFARAAEDLTWAPAGTLHRRFLGWLRGGHEDDALGTRTP